MRSFLLVLIAGALAIFLTLMTAEALAFAGMRHDGFVKTGLCALWLLAVFQGWAFWRARRTWQ